MPGSKDPESFKHSGLLGIIAALAIVVTVTGLVHARVGFAEAPQTRSPLPVATIQFEQQTSYKRKVSYLGLVVAGRKARLGFELPGLLSSLPLRQGSPVKAGELVATLDDSALQAKRNATSAELEQARTELELAQLKSRRQQELAASGAVSKEAVDETRLRAQALESRLAAVTARLAGIDIDLAKSRLVAPYDGIVADHYVHEGSVVSPGTPVVRLIETAGKEAHIGVTASRVGDLVIGHKYLLQMHGTKFEASLFSIRPDIDPVTRTATAVFTLPDTIDTLDGEPVSLVLDETIEMTGGWLPMDALLEGKRGLWNVLRIQRDGDILRSAREAVEVLEVRGDKVYVRGTLASGDQVIASGLHRITAGSPVTPMAQN